MTEPEVYELTQPIHVYAVTAERFPEGLGKAFEKLEAAAPRTEQRKFYGISWGGPSITYMAATTELHEGELKDKGLEEFTIKKGNYLSVMVEGYDNIAAAIQNLIQDPRIDPKGYCVEMYLEGQKVRCMVTLKD